LQHARLRRGKPNAPCARAARASHNRHGGFDRAVSGLRGETGSDPTSHALARLEAAVERLAESAARPRAEAAASGEGVPRAAVAAIADRLDETIARLRAALGEDI
jgi:hypothetical protein